MHINFFNYRAEKYYPPVNRLEESLNHGERVYKLASLLLADKSKIQELTVHCLVQWAKDIHNQKRKSWQTKAYQSSPDQLLFNRFHRLQKRVFEKLEVEEKAEEKGGSGLEIHPWVLTLRYVKAILTITSSKSEYRSIGMCRILRSYTTRETIEILTGLWLDENDPDHEEYARVIDEQHLNNVASRFFGSKTTEIGTRFEQFADTREKERVLLPHSFETVPDSDPIIPWVSEQLDDHLAPWGVILDDPESYPPKTKSNNFLARAYQRIVRANAPPAEIYSSLDEIRMFILTSARKFELALKKPLDADIEYKPLRLPIMNSKRPSSNQLPPPACPDAWSIEQRQEATYAMTSNTVACRKGWRSDALSINISGKYHDCFDLFRQSDELQFEMEIDLVNFLGVYYVSAEGTHLLFEFRLDHEEIYENGAYFDEYKGEGNQLLTVSIVESEATGSIPEERYQLTLTYREPSTWRHIRLARRAWSEAMLAPQRILGYATLILLLVLLPIVGYFLRPFETTVSEEMQSPPTTLEQIAIDEKVIVGEPSKPLNDESSANKPVADPKSSRTRKNGIERTPNSSTPHSLRRKEPSEGSVAQADLAQVLDSRLGSLPLSSAIGVERSGDGSRDHTARPDGTFVRAGNVKFGWIPTSVSGISSFDFELRDSNDAAITVVRDSQGTGNSIVVPQLKPGELYRWELRTGGNKLKRSTPYIVAKGTFATLPATLETELDAALERPESDDKLSRIALFIRYGLLDDATDQLETYLRMNPGSKAALKLRQKLGKLKPRINKKVNPKVRKRVGKGI